VEDPVAPTDASRSRVIAITGTPGTGKSTLADQLRMAGKTVLDLNEIVEQEGLRSGRDRERDTWMVDTDQFGTVIPKYITEDPTFIEGHLSHWFPTSYGILLRTDPERLCGRLLGRGWSRAKIEENVHAEILDIIKGEMYQQGFKVILELDSTDTAPEEQLAVVLRFIDDPQTQGTRKINWLERYEDWLIKGIPETLLTVPPQSKK